MNKRSSPPAPRPTLQTLATIYEAISESQSIGPALSYFSSASSSSRVANNAPPAVVDEGDDEEQEESFQDEEQGDSSGNAKPRAIVYDNHNNNDPALQQQQQQRPRTRKLFSVRTCFTLTFIAMVVAAAMLLGFNGFLNNNDDNNDNDNNESTLATGNEFATSNNNNNNNGASPTPTAAPIPNTPVTAPTSTSTTTTSDSSDSSSDGTTLAETGSSFSWSGQEQVPTLAPTLNPSCPKPPPGDKNDENGHGLAEQQQQQGEDTMVKTVYKVAVEQKYDSSCEPIQGEEEDEDDDGLVVNLQCPSKIELGELNPLADCQQLSATLVQCKVPEGIEPVGDWGNDNQGMLLLIMRDISVACWGYEAEERRLAADVPSRTVSCRQQGVIRLSVTARIADPASCATAAHRTCLKGYEGSRSADLPNGDECWHRDPCRGGSVGVCHATAAVSLRLHLPENDCSVAVQTETPGAEGDACEFNDDCLSGVCFGSVCWSGRLCDTQECSANAHCQSHFCDKTTTNGNGTCQPFQAEDLDPGPFSLHNHHPHHAGGNEDNLGQRQ